MVLPITSLFKYSDRILGNVQLVVIGQSSLLVVSCRLVIHDSCDRSALV